MSIVAPYSKHRKGNLKIFIVVLLAAAIWFAYDGHFNENFIEKHTIQKLDDQGEPVLDETGQPVMVPDADLIINRTLPPFLVLGAVVLAAILMVVNKKKIVLEDNILKAYGRQINVNNIEKIDKTNFESKGVFTITYKDDSGNEKELKFSDKAYDNIKAVLDEIVKKISE